jgi:hypothetical protein
MLFSGCTSRACSAAFPSENSWPHRQRAGPKRDSPKPRTVDDGYATDVLEKRDAVQLELLTVEVITLADGQGTRYRAELNVKLPGLDTMTPDDVKKSIETVVADPAAVSAVQSKTVKLGMSPDEVKQSLGNPDKIVDLGAKQVFIYKDLKVILVDGKVSDVQ